MSPKVGAPPGRGPRARHSPHPAEGTAAVGAAALPGLIPWEHSLAHRQAQLLTLLEVGASLICGFWPPGPHPGTLTLALHTHLSPLRPSHTHAFVQPVSPPTSPLRGSPVSSLLSHTFHFLSSLLLRSAHHSAVSGCTFHVHFPAPRCDVVNVVLTLHFLNTHGWSFCVPCMLPRSGVGDELGALWAPSVRVPPHSTSWVLPCPPSHSRDSPVEMGSHEAPKLLPSPTAKFCCLGDGFWGASCCSAGERGPHLPSPASPVLLSLLSWLSVRVTLELRAPFPPHCPPQSSPPLSSPPEGLPNST